MLETLALITMFSVLEGLRFCDDLMDPVEVEDK